MLIFLEAISTAVIAVLCLSALFKAETKERELHSAIERQFQTFKDELEWKPSELFTKNCHLNVSSLNKASLTCKKAAAPNHPEVKDVLLFDYKFSPSARHCNA